MAKRKRSLREARHVDKWNFIGANDRFYEQNYDQYLPSEELASIVRPALQAHGRGWTIHRIGVWSHVVANGDTSANKLPVQGWKIHVSAIEANCRDILTKVVDLALGRNVQFKFANDINTLKMMTSKRWPRGGSGKFITIYPVNDEEFKSFIEEAYDALKSFDGSYILSDKRYKDCHCLYYRYGGILQVTRLEYMGHTVPIITGPEGEQVVDTRNPFFEVPSWASDPFPDSESDPGEMSLKDGRYVVKSALGFSNTGGVYLATDTTTDRDVVIKEARPHVELYANGGDATTRLSREMRNLNLLSPIGVSPKVLDSFSDWENLYLVEEHLDAFDMREVMLVHSPLLRVNPSRADSVAFYGIFKTIFTNLLTAIDLAHSEGIVIGDLSPPNVLVDKTSMSVHLIDLEAAFKPDSGDSDDIHTLGFRSAVKGRKKANSFEDDRYAAAAIMMYSMFPIVAMAYIRDDLFENVLPVMIADIGWKNTPVQEIIVKLAFSRISLRDAIEMLDGVATVAAPYAHSAQSGTSNVDPATNCAMLAKFISENFRTDPKYTLFPTDPFAGHTNASGLGFGASGIVYALKSCGFPLPDEALARYNKELSELSPESVPPGFLTGFAGIAWATLSTGPVAQALQYLDLANASTLVRSHHSLYYGMAGIGMTNLAAYRATGYDHYLNIATDLAGTLASTAIEDERGLHWEEDDGGIRIGLGYGQAGVALFFLRLSQVLGEPTWRELGLKAFRYDLSFGFELESGIVTFPCAPEETNTYEHYLEQGTAGIAKVAIRFGMWEEVDRLLHDLHRKYSGFSGLIYGLAGFVDVLVDAYLYSGDKKYLEMAQRPYQGLCDLYIFPEGDAFAVPGENLFRISTDYATGCAGVVKALHRLSSPAPDEFFLDEIDKIVAGVQSRSFGAQATGLEIA